MHTIESTPPVAAMRAAASPIASESAIKTWGHFSADREP
jgi:TRAP-type uncharacterized transport system fused permease subunit